MACFWSLPEAVRARDGTNETPTGHLKWARRSRVQAISSASDTSASGRRTTTAYGDSPHSAEGTPTTATSATAGWPVITLSTSAGYTFSPPVTIMSLSRSCR